MAKDMLYHRPNALDRITADIKTRQNTLTTIVGHGISAGL
jgi:hypothetical protein